MVTDGDWYRRSLAISEELCNRPGLALTYGQLGLLAEARQEVAEALDSIVRCLALFPEFPHPVIGPGPPPGRGTSSLSTGRACQPRWRPSSLPAARTAGHPGRYDAGLAVSVAPLIVAVAQLAQSVYATRRQQAAGPDAGATAREIRIELRQREIELLEQTLRIIEFIAAEITRQERRPEKATDRRAMLGPAAGSSQSRRLPGHGLSSGLVHPRPRPFTGVRSRASSLVADGGSHW